MKRFFAALLAVSMLLTFGAAVAEEEVTITVPEFQSINPTLKDSSAMSIESTDVVTVDGNHTTVVADGLQLDLELDPTLGMMCLTQDFAASFENYFMFDDSEEVYNWLIENNVHLWLSSTYTSNQYSFVLPGKDNLSAKVVDLGAMSENIRDLYIAKIAEAFGVDNYTVITASGVSWILATDYGTAFTIAGGQYVFCYIGFSGDTMSQDDVDEATDVFSCLTISAVN